MISAVIFLFTTFLFYISPQPAQSNLYERDWLVSDCVKRTNNKSKCELEADSEMRKAKGAVK